MHLYRIYEVLFSYQCCVAKMPGRSYTSVLITAEMSGMNGIDLVSG